MNWKWLLPVVLLLTSCDTCRSIDSVERPTEEMLFDSGSTPSPDASDSGSGFFDATSQPSPDIGASDVGEDPDAAPDMTFIEGCPRQGSTLGWALTVATVPKVSDVPSLASADAVAPYIDLTSAGTPDQPGMLAFAFRYLVGADFYGVIYMFEPGADITMREGYSSFDVILPNVDVTRIAVRGDDQERDKFHFAATGAPLGCVDEARTGAFGDITPSGGGAVPDFVTFLTDCERVQPPVGVVGPYGPGAPAMVARDTIAQTPTYLLKQADAQLQQGPAWGGWTDRMSVSRRELVLVPDGLIGEWQAWFPLLDQSIGGLELGTGEVSMDWLYDDCHALAVENGTTIEVNALECSTAQCDFVPQPGIDAPGEVAHVDVAPMPGGGFVVAFATSSEVFASFYNDDFQPVAVNEQGGAVSIGAPAGIVGDLAVAAVGPVDSPQVFVAFSDVDAEIANRLAVLSLVPR